MAIGSIDDHPDASNLNLEGGIKFLEPPNLAQEVRPSSSTFQMLVSLSFPVKSPSCPRRATGLVFLGSRRKCTPFHSLGKVEETHHACPCSGEGLLPLSPFPQESFITFSLSRYSPSVIFTKPAGKPELVHTEPES
jgi:hypothetical protein